MMKLSREIVFPILSISILAITIASLQAAPTGGDLQSRSLINCRSFKTMLGFISANHLALQSKSPSFELINTVSQSVESELRDRKNNLNVVAMTHFARLADVVPQLLACEESQLELDIGVANFTRLSELFLKKFMGSLDTYSDFITSEEIERRMGAIEGQFVGVGIATDRRAGYLLVLEVLKNSPAEIAGVRVNDRIRKIDGMSVQGKDDKAISAAIRGQEGTSVRFTVERNRKVTELTIARKIVSVDSVYSKWINRTKGVAYIELNHFYPTTVRELLRHWYRLNRTGVVRSLVLDLRYNPGGLLDVARDVVDLFIDTGPVVHIRGTSNETIYARNRGMLINVPVAVLVNDRSASAAEIVAGALQSYHRAVLIGTKTFGKSTVQTIFETARLFGINYDGALKVTGYAFYLPDGRPTSAISPDIFIRNPAIKSAGQTAEKSIPLNQRGILIDTPIETPFKNSPSRRYQVLVSRAQTIADSLAQERHQFETNRARDLQFTVATSLFKN